jgi:hypothetical protein
MPRLFVLIVLLGLSVIAVAPRAARACPLCAEGVAAPSSGSEEYDTDPVREARAYNNSIYLFVVTPYVLLATFAFFVHRGMKKNRAARLSAANSGNPVPAPSAASTDTSSSRPA